MNTNFTRTNFLTYFYDKHPKVRTKTKIGMLVNTAPGFRLMSPASRSRMKRRKGGSAGGIDFEDLMMKCRQKVVVEGLNGQKLTTSGY